LDINHWAALAGNGMSTFQITNAFGNPVERLVQEGDYVKIDIPGLGSIFRCVGNWDHLDRAYGLKI